MPDNSKHSVYGFPDAATAFDSRHPQWREVMPRISRLVDLAFTRTQIMNLPIEKFVYFYGSVVTEDFMEIFLMAANGYGYGAMKLLRSMYEHTVTLKYIHDNPNELDALFGFDRVQQYKLMKPILETFGTNAIPPDIIKKTEQRYQELRHKFLVKSCKSKTCTEQRVAHTWSKLDFVSMARETGELGTLIVPGYFFPLRHAHGTLRAMTSRIERGDARWGFNRESQPEEADQALMTAHNCLLIAMGAQEERFKVAGLKPAIEQARRDWFLVWSPDRLVEIEASAAERP